MTDTARNYQTPTAADTTGLDHLFVHQSDLSVEGTAQGMTDHTIEVMADLAQIVPDPSLEGTADPIQGVSLTEASQLLNLHVDTIKKRLRKGTLKGFKVQEKFGDKWFVDKSELPDITDHIQAVTEVVADPIQVVSDHSPEVTADPSTVTPDPTQQIPTLDKLLTALEKKDAVIEGQAHQLKAAGDVIMYLRAQIDQKDTELKLLTDSQHRGGWWSRFSSWFFKSR